MKLSHQYATQLTDLTSLVAPQPLENTQISLVNSALASRFSLPDQWWQNNAICDELFTPTGTLSQQAVAQKYGGHQFGHWNPMLGDGRGLLLAEVTDANGCSFDLHLKGAGPTPYSRHADGRAVLRSTIREYIGSEALHHLGIPSSRSLCLLSSTDTVYRERPEPGAMMIRMAPSHIRFGHFEYFFHSKEQDKLKALMDFTLENYFPECLQSTNPPLAMLTQITLRTARMIALWQAYGFVHGVMNTDNMSVHGITFDYGPYAFMDTFKPDAVFNHSDHEGRYAFDKQPGIGLWNLNALAYAFTDYGSIDEIKAALMRYEPTFIEQYQSLMATRLGFADPSEPHIQCMNHWQNLLAADGRDYTATFSALAQADISEKTSSLRDHFIRREEFDAWWETYRALRKDNDMPQQQMQDANPVMILRTHHLQNAIDAAQNGDFTLCDKLLKAIQTPFTNNEHTKAFLDVPDNNSQVSLSCSS